MTMNFPRFDVSVALPQDSWQYDMTPLRQKCNLALRHNPGVIPECDNNPCTRPKQRELGNMLPIDLPPQNVLTISLL